MAILGMVALAASRAVLSALPVSRAPALADTAAIAPSILSLSALKTTRWTLSPAAHWFSW